MDQAAIDAFTNDIRDAVLASRGLDASSVDDLGGFESFVYAVPARGSILRATHASHRSAEEVRAELEWIDDLARHGAAVSTPIADRAGELVTEVGDFRVTEFERAPGRTITEDDWGPALFRNWGQAIGTFHRLSRRFQPNHSRLHWRDDPNFEWTGRIPADEVQVVAAARGARAELEALPETSETFGLIHCDAHAGNFFIDGERLTFFDFDDTCRCFYGYDVATVLFGAVLQPWIGDEDADRVAAARAFLEPFLDGYARESDPLHLRLADFPLFLKVREAGLYGVIHAFFDVDNLDDWYPAKFMAGRRERLEQGVPYLELDFTTPGTGG